MRVSVLTRLSFICVVLCFTAMELSAENWILEEEEDIVRSIVSPRGTFMVHIVDESDYVMKCTNLENGKLIWSRQFEDIDESNAVFFISSRDEVIFSTKDSLYFLASADGEVLKQLELCPDGSGRAVRRATLQVDGDMRWLADRYFPYGIWTEFVDIESLIEYHVDDSLLVIYLDGAIQMIDLVDRRSIHFGEDDMRDPQLLRLGNYALLAGSEDSDFLYVLDYSKRELLHIHDNSEAPILRYYREPAAVQDSLLVFLTQKGAYTINTIGKAAFQPLEFNSEDADALRFFKSDEDIFIVQSHKNQQAVFSVAGLRKLWDYQSDGVLSGIVDTVVFLDNNDALWCLHSPGMESLVSLARINMQTGEVLWRCSLSTGAWQFFSDYGNIRQGKFRFLSYIFGRSNEQSLRPNGASYLQITGLSDSMAHGFLAGFLSRSSMVPEHSDDLDGELFFSIDLESGELVKRQPAHIVPLRYRMPSRLNPRLINKWGYQSKIPVIKNCFEVREMDDQFLGIGSEHLYLFHRDGEIDSLKLADTQIQYGLILVNGHRNNGSIVVRAKYTSWYDYWDVKVENGKIETTLLIRSRNTDIEISDSADLKYTYEFGHGEIKAFPIVRNPEKWVNLGKEAWKVSLYDYDEIVQSDIDLNWTIHTRNDGIAVTTDSEIVMTSPKGILVISADGEVSVEEQMDLSSLQPRRLFTTVAGRSIVLESGSQIIAVRLDGGESPVWKCQLKEYGDWLPFVTNEGGKLVIVNKDENRIICRDLR